MQGTTTNRAESPLQGLVSALLATTSATPDGAFLIFPSKQSLNNFLSLRRAALLDYTESRKEQALVIECENGGEGLVLPLLESGPAAPLPPVEIFRRHDEGRHNVEERRDNSPFSVNLGAFRETVRTAGRIDYEVSTEGDVLLPPYTLKEEAAAVLAAITGCECSRCQRYREQNR